MTVAIIISLTANLILLIKYITTASDRADLRLENLSLKTENSSLTKANEGLQEAYDESEKLLQGLAEEIIGLDSVGFYNKWVLSPGEDGGSN